MLREDSKFYFRQIFSVMFLIKLFICAFYKRVCVFLDSLIKSY